MGQYFIIVNLDKKEYIDPPDAAKLWEICANNSVRMLAYLLATNNWDGTNIPKHFSSNGDKKKVISRIKKELGRDYEVEVHNVTCGENGECSGYVVPKLKYFGRWCGDRVVVLGDYADDATNTGPDFPKYYDVLNDPRWRDITDEVIREFNWFIGDEDLKVGTNDERYELEKEIENILEQIIEECKAIAGNSPVCVKAKNLYGRYMRQKTVAHSTLEDINSRIKDAYKDIERLRKEGLDVVGKYIRQLKIIRGMAKKLLAEHKLLDS